MKLSLRSKLITRVTAGVSVRTERPIAESASVPIIPPWTKPEWLAMSSVPVISTTAVPSPVSTSCIPSHSHAREGAFTTSLTALSLWHGHARGGGPGDQAVPVVQHVGLAEQQRLLHLDHAADCAEAALHDRAQEV